MSTLNGIQKLISRIFFLHWSQQSRGAYPLKTWKVHELRCKQCLIVSSADENRNMRHQVCVLLKETK